MKLIHGLSTTISCSHLAVFLLIVPALIFVPAVVFGQTGQSSETAAVLYQFTGGTDGGAPNAGVIFDNAGNLYGTTTTGGLFGHGTVYELSPSPSGWTESVLYSFTGGPDGDLPRGGVIFDGAGNLYGTTYQGGVCCGTVFELVKTGDSWSFNLLHTFTGGDDGANPAAGLVWGPNGLFGTTENGGFTSGLCGPRYEVGCGTVFRLFPYGVWSKFTMTTGVNPHSSLLYEEGGGYDCYWGTTMWGRGIGGWGTLFVDCDRAVMSVHTFSHDGAAGSVPHGGVVMDSAGNVYGTTSFGYGFRGAVFEFSYTPRGGTVKALHQFVGLDGDQPMGDLTLDADGNIYGTTCCGGSNNQGVIFKLTPQLKGKWAETVLHSLTGNDGGHPQSGLVFDSADNLYGTAFDGGAYGAGVVFKVPNQRVGAQAILAPTGLRFAKQVINTSSVAKTVTLSNSGDTLLKISNITITPSDNFAVSSKTCGTQLGPGAQCTVSVTFTPAAVGPLAATLTFTDNAPNSPQTLGLMGTGIWPATLMPVGATYPKQAVGTTSLPKSFTLTNNQAVSLDGIAISTTGDFAVSETTCATSLAAKSKCTISVTFTPTQTGTRTGTVTVSDNASNSPQLSNLTGTGK